MTPALPLVKEWLVVWVWLRSPWYQDKAWSLLRKFFLSSAFFDIGHAANWTVFPWNEEGTGCTWHTTSLCTGRWYGYPTRSDNNIGYHTCVFHTGANKTRLALWYWTSDSTWVIVGLHIPETDSIFVGRNLLFLPGGLVSSWRIVDFKSGFNQLRATRLTF